MNSLRSLASACLLAALLATPLAGCSSKVWGPVSSEELADRSVPALPPPDPVSPAQTLSALAWSVNHLSVPHFSTLFTADYRFRFAAADSAGNAYADRSLTRDDEIEIAQHMFVTGTASEPAVWRAVLTIQTASIVTHPDSRPGKDPGWHREVTAPLVLRLDTHEASYWISGAIRLYVVRGDSAQIPLDLVARGFGPDPSRWWIERWDDETLEVPPGISSSSHPTRARSWGAIKTLYR